MAVSHLGSPFLVKLTPGLSCCQVTAWYELSPSLWPIPQLMQVRYSLCSKCCCWGFCFNTSGRSYRLMLWEDREGNFNCFATKFLYLIITILFQTTQQVTQISGHTPVFCVLWQRYLDKNSRALSNSHSVVCRQESHITRLPYGFKSLYTSTVLVWPERTSCHTPDMQ